MSRFPVTMLSLLCLLWTSATAFGAPRVVPTERYNREMLRLMLAEANRIAAEMKLDEQLPITVTNLTLVFLIPAGKTYGYVGVIDTRNYAYTMDMNEFGIVCSVIGRKGYQDLYEARRNYVWPISRFDSNRVFQAAVELMKKAGMDVDRLNRDCRVRIDFPEYKGLFSHMFSPIYTVTWSPKTKTFWSENVGGGIEFIEPLRQVRSLDVKDLKYNLRKPLESANLVQLLTPENTEETVRNEMDMSTNYVARMKDFQRGGASESLLRKIWGGYTGDPFPTNLLARTNALPDSPLPGKP
jgi:hypothetical protein